MTTVAAILVAIDSVIWMILVIQLWLNRLLGRSLSVLLLLAEDGRHPNPIFSAPRLDSAKRDGVLPHERDAAQLLLGFSSFLSCRKSSIKRAK